MSRKVGALRDAPNAGKRPLLDALSRAPCSAPDVCELKRVCVDAYRSHVQTVEQSQSLQKSLDREGAPASQSADLARLLRALELRLAQARQATQRCAELDGEVTRAHLR